MNKFLFEKHNPWWKNKKAIEKDIVLKEFKEQKYKYYHPFLKNLPKKDAVFLIRGPRRIGKTTLLKIAIKKLLKTKKAENIFFYPCDRIENYDSLYNLMALYLGRKIKGRKYIFLDEISFVKKWQRAVKSLHDSGDLRNCTLIITGSNALDLKFSSERLPGRRGKTTKQDIDYYPLGFKEFTSMVNKANTEKLFKDYLICGGFPDSINQYYQKSFIPNWVYDTYLKWIEGDIHKVGKREKTMYAIAEQIFKHLGSRGSWYKIAKNTGIGSHSTVEDYVDILDKMFVVFLLHFYSIEEKKTYLNKNKKFYFLDPIIFHALRAKVDNFPDNFFRYSQNFLEQGSLSGLVENIVACYLYKLPGKLAYGNYRNKEIDFVWQYKGREKYFEVKYKENINLSEFKHWDKKEQLTIITKNFTFKKDNLKFVKIDDFLKKEEIQ